MITFMSGNTVVVWLKKNHDQLFVEWFIKSMFPSIIEDVAKGKFYWIVVIAWMANSSKCVGINVNSHDGDMCWETGIA